MFNGIFNQFLDQSVENPPKIVGGANRQTKPNRKIRPLWGDSVFITHFGNFIDI